MNECAIPLTCLAPPTDRLAIALRDLAAQYERSAQLDPSEAGAAVTRQTAAILRRAAVSISFTTT